MMREKNQIHSEIDIDDYTRLYAYIKTCVINLVNRHPAPLSPMEKEEVIENSVCNAMLGVLKNYREVKEASVNTYAAIAARRRAYMYINRVMKRSIRRKEHLKRRLDQSIADAKIDNFIGLDDDFYSRGVDFLVYAENIDILICSWSQGKLTKWDKQAITEMRKRAPSFSIAEKSLKSWAILLQYKRDVCGKGSQSHLAKVRNITRQAASQIAQSMDRHLRRFDWVVDCINVLGGVDEEYRRYERDI